MINLLIQGGWFMVPLMVCSVVGLAIVMDRWLYLRAAWREADHVLPQIDALSAADNVDGLESFCNANPSLLTGIFLEGIRKYRVLRDDPNIDFVQHEISRMMEDASIANTNDLERHLPLLASVGNVAPLFGFAGTVTGMIHAFEKIASSANPNAQLVASGIQEALITTAAGLVIAIPAVLLYNYFVARIDALNARTEESANSMIDMCVMSMVHERRTTRRGRKNRADAQAKTA